MSNSIWIGGAVFIIIGVLVDIAGMVLKFYSANTGSYEGYAEAKVVDIIPVKREPYVQSEFRNRQAAVFEFYADGKLIKITDTEDTYPCPYSLHERVRINYDPEDPTVYRILQKERKQYLPLALNVTGVIMILIGMLMFLKYALRYML